MMQHEGDVPHGGDTRGPGERGTTLDQETTGPRRLHSVARGKQRDGYGRLWDQESEGLRGTTGSEDYGTTNKEDYEIKENTGPRGKKTMRPREYEATKHENKGNEKP